MPALLALIAVGFAAIGFATVFLARERNKQPVSTNNAIRSLFAIGTQVMVLEQLERTDMTWIATVLGTQGGQVTVRDIEYPYSTLTLPKDYIFPLGTEFNQ